MQPSKISQLQYFSSRVCIVLNTLSFSSIFSIFEPGHEKMCLLSYANNKGTDQPAHPRGLIGAFVVRCQERMIPLVYISEISRF